MALHSLLSGHGASTTLFFWSTPSSSSMSMFSSGSSVKSKRATGYVTTLFGLHFPIKFCFLLFSWICLLNFVLWLLQMIDLYWTVIPMLLVYYYATYPLAQYNLWRSRIVIALTWIWSLRLTHNYFRREKWQWGVREDWRFTDMRGQYGKHWWWISFFSVYASQQVMYDCIFAYLY